MDTSCPYCGGALSRLGFLETDSDHPWDLACFSDDCPYYQRGWRWMEEHYGVSVSYRYRVDGRSGQEMPIPVWSPSALRSLVLPDEPAPARRAS